MAVRKANDERIITFIAYTIMSFLAVVMLYPLLNVLSISLSDYSEYIANPSMVFPKHFTLDAYKQIFSTNIIVRGYYNTIFITLVGTLISISATALFAYPLAKAKVKGSRFLTFLVIFSMLFRAGIIPDYITIRALGLIDSLWALILCRAISPFNFLIMKANMESIPDSLEEAAKIEGAGPLTILNRIVLPLCKPVFVAISLFYAVAHWNRFFEAILYINTRTKWTMSLILREIITEDPEAICEAAEQAAFVFPKTLQTAVIIITIVPIMMIYPFIHLSRNILFPARCLDLLRNENI